MLTKIILANFLLGIAILCLPTYKEKFVYLEAPKLPPTAYIALYSEQYGVSQETMLKIAKCESTLKIDAINYNDGGKGKHSVGIMQFQKSTFDLWSAKLGEELDYYSYQDQIKLASYMVSKGQIKQWTCGRKIDKIG